MKRFLSVLLVGILSFCTACTPAQAGSNATAAPTAQTDKELTACTAVNDKGFYSVEVYRQDIANIMYLDFATGQQIFLCNRPECKHDNESCNSYFSIKGEYLPALRLAGKHILLMRTGGSEELPPQITIRDLDGANRQTLCEFKSNQNIATELYTDGDFIYFGLTTTNKEDLTQTESLVKVSLQTGQLDTLHTYPANEAPHIFFGAYQGKLIVDADLVDAAGKPWRSFYWLDTGKTDGEALSKEPFYTYAADEKGVLFSGECMYVDDKKSSVLTEQNMATGKQRSWDCSNLTKNMVDYGSMSFGPIFDDYFSLLIIENSDDKPFEAKEYLLNLMDGSVIPETLRCSYNGHDLEIISVYQDSLCVIADYKDDAFQYEDEEGIHEYESVTPVYAMIDKKDYIASNPNYRIIPAPTIPTGAVG